MGANIRELRDRVGSVKNTKKITSDRQGYFQKRFLACGLKSVSKSVFDFVVVSSKLRWSKTVAVAIAQAMSGPRFHCSRSAMKLVAAAKVRRAQEARATALEDHWDLGLISDHGYVKE